MDRGMIKKKVNLEERIKRLSLKCPCSERSDILVVDDNVFNIMTLQCILDDGLQLKSDKALNGQEAVNRVLDR